MTKVLVIAVLLQLKLCCFTINGQMIQQNARADERSRDIRLPKSDGHAQAVSSYVEDVPDKDYYHAPAEAYEAFQDMKYGIRIHWGIYSALQMNGESWGFLQLNNADKQRYHEYYKQFNPVDFDAEKWMRFFDTAGFKCMAFTTKHHEGFSMFDTKTRVMQRAHYYPDGTAKLESCNLAYSIMETPFKRDIVGELCTAARSHQIKIDLYFSHPDWYDADFRPLVYSPIQTAKSKMQPALYGGDKANFTASYSNFITPEPTAAETKRMLARHRAQLNELLSNYGEIDMVCLDMWLSKMVWPQLKETIKLIRKAHPNVMLRARGIGNYGDYYTPEGFVPGSKENTHMPWMTIHVLGSSFSYDSVASHYKGAKWVIDNLADAVAKGGNFMVGIGPDGRGNFHPEAVRQLDSAGRWLQINGEAIYATRPRQVWMQGDSIRFTTTKDSSIVYAIALKWPGTQLHIPSLGRTAISEVSMLGYPQQLKWEQKADELIIDIPEPGKDDPISSALAWVVRVKQH